MLIASKTSRLAKTVEDILSHPKEYGIRTAVDGSIDIELLFESVLLFREWEWLNIFDMENIVRGMGTVVFDNRQISFSHAVKEQSVGKSIAKEQRLPESLFLPLPLKKHSNSKLYTELRTAVIISGHRNGDFEKASVRQFATSDVLKAGCAINPLVEGIFTSVDVDIESGKILRGNSFKEILEQFYIELTFNELLYIDDEGYQISSCRYLYEKLPQLEMEKKLIKHIYSPDHDVRKNACFALSYPVSSIKVKLNAPFVHWKELVEKRTLSQRTIHHILVALTKENNVEVMENIINLLKVQNYKGELLYLAKYVKKAISRVITVIDEEQTISDCKQFLKQLSNLVFIEKVIDANKSPRVKTNEQALPISIDSGNYDFKYSNYDIRNSNEIGEKRRAGTDNIPSETKPRDGQRVLQRMLSVFTFLISAPYKSNLLKERRHAR